MTSLSVSAASPPLYPPSQFSHTIINSTSVSLTWEVPANYSANEITGFSLVYKTNVGQVIPVDTDIGPEVRSTEVTDLTPGSTYTFRLSLLNQFGVGPSRNITVTLPGGEEEIRKSNIRNEFMLKLTHGHYRFITVNHPFTRAMRSPRERCGLHDISIVTVVKIASM